jgi:hypothetical protein
MRTGKRDEKGAAAAELAIVLPIFIILVFGIVEFGLAFNRLQGVHAAAREGARIGAVAPGAECAQALDALDGLGVTGFACTVSQSCPGDKVIVEVSASEEIDIPIVGTRTVSLSGRGEFRCEG